MQSHPGTRRRAVRCVRVGALAVLPLTLAVSACGVQWTAHKLIVRADRDGVHLIQHAPTTGDIAVPAGETVITLDNGDPTATHTLMLLRTDTPATQLPARIREARIPSDAPDVLVDVTQPLAADKRTFLTGGGLAEDIDEAVFHVYLQPNAHYLIVDPDDIDRGFALRLIALGQP